jgi:hypothetical protein
MRELLIGITPGNELGCPNCGCGGDSCGADGCICCRNECHDVQVKNATPAGYTDDNGEWWRKSTTPLTADVLSEPVVWQTNVHRQGTTLEGLFPINDKPTDVPSFGYAWIEFHDADGIVRYYTPMQDPSKISLSMVTNEGWALRLHDPQAMWIAEPSYTWRLVVMAQGDESIAVELNGTWEA